MNGDPYRTPQPADRRVINRSGQAYRQPDEPQQPVKEETPKTAPRSTASSRSTSHKKPSGRWGWIVASIVLVIAIAAIGWFAWSSAKKSDAGIDSSKYQSVYLMNGQLYFGKLESLDDTHMRLTSVYYLQTKDGEVASQQDAEETSTTTNNVQLVKLSNAIYGPSDEMIISKDQILYYQNLKDDSKATQLIENDK